jgi:hypothetical protein
MRDVPDLGLRMCQQRIARCRLTEVTDKGEGEVRPARGFDRRIHPLRADIGEHGFDALADQRQRDRAADAVARAGHQRRLARGIEGRAEEAHVGRSPGSKRRAC